VFKKIIIYSKLNFVSNNTLNFCGFLIFMKLITNENPHFVLYFFPLFYEFSSRILDKQSNLWPFQAMVAKNMWKDLNYAIVFNSFISSFFYILTIMFCHDLNFYDNFLFFILLFLFFYHFNLVQLIIRLLNSRGIHTPFDQEKISSWFTALMVVFVYPIFFIPSILWFSRLINLKVPAGNALLIWFYKTPCSLMILQYIILMISLPFIYKKTKLKFNLNLKRLRN